MNMPSRLVRNWMNNTAFWGGLLLAGILAASLAAPWLAPFDPNQQDADGMLQPPSVIHWCGTDQFGRDIFSRILYGGRISLSAAGAALVIVVSVGLSAGLLSGYAGGWVDNIIMRLVDLLLAFPPIILALVIAGLFEPNLINVVLSMSLVMWLSFARVTRSIVLQAKADPAVDAAKALGATPIRIIRQEILPRVFGPIIVLAAIETGYLILAIAGLSFLGLGAQPPLPEWGTMLAEGRVQFLTSIHVILFPGIAILLTVLACNLIGEGLRDLLDPSDAALKTENPQ